MPGMTILHYEFLEKIGSGGMGEIYRAHDKRLNRYVAIKALPYGKSGDPDRRRRFIQEAQAASALNHPNIVTIHDIFHEGDTHFIVMELVTGHTLLEAIPDGGMPLNQMLLCSAQMADALSAAHAAGIVHRDFKPANVMVTSSGLVKILDFGLAKLLQPHSIWANAEAASGDSETIQMVNPATRTSAPQTAEGSILGTVNYMSPEQAEGKKVDARADIFSLGAVMYEMLTARRAFHGDSDIATLSAVLRDEPKPISEVVPGVPKELEDLIRVCLRKDPNSRWQTMKEVELGLSELKRRADAGELSAHPVSANRETVKPAPAAAAPPARNKLLAGAALVAALLLVAGGAAWFIAKNRSQSSSPVAQFSVPAAQPQGSTLPSPVIGEPQPAAPSVTTSDSTPSATAPPAPPPASGSSPERPKQTAPPPVTSDSASSAPAQPVAPPPVTPARPVRPETVAPTPATMTVSIGDGIPFRIALAEDVANDAEEGKQILFRAADDVKAGEVLVIARGATVRGSIVNGNGKRFLGIGGGKMTYQLISADTVDGQKIPVRASVARRTDGPTARPVDTGKYAKPKELAAARGTDYIAYIDGDQTVTLKK